MRASGKSCRENADVYLPFEIGTKCCPVIASAAKQSIRNRAKKDGLLRCARNDDAKRGLGSWPPASYISKSIRCGISGMSAGGIG